MYVSILIRFVNFARCVALLITLISLTGSSKFDYGCKNVNDVSPNLCSISEDFCDKDVVEESDEDFEKAMLVVEGLCDVNSKGNGGVVNLSGDFDQMKPLEVDEIGGIGGKNGEISSASVCKNDIDSSNVSVSRSKLVTKLPVSKILYLHSHSLIDMRQVIKLHFEFHNWPCIIFNYTKCLFRF